MNLYCIKRKDKPGWDEALGFVIRAKSNRRAREIASQEHSDEGAEVWLSTHTSYIEIIATNVRGPERVILKSFRAG